MIVFLPNHLAARGPIPAENKLVKVIMKEPTKGEIGKVPFVSSSTFNKRVVLNATIGPIAHMCAVIPTKTLIQVERQY